MTRYEQDPLYGVCLDDILEWVPRVPPGELSLDAREPAAEPSATTLLVRELLLEIGTGPAAPQLDDDDLVELEVVERCPRRARDRTLPLDEGDLEPIEERGEVTEPPVPSRRAAGILSVAALLLLMGALIHVTSPRPTPLLPTTLSLQTVVSSDF